VLPDAILCVIGLLGDQPRAKTETAHATSIIRTNFEGPALLLGLFAERFVALGTGTLVAVSSVAGERGRASNYIYGASKAGLTAFLSGLRNRLGKTKIRVITQTGLCPHAHDKRHEAAGPPDRGAGAGGASDFQRGHGPAPRRHLCQTGLAGHHDHHQGESRARLQEAADLMGDN
jgi:NAD(P)-dependent dehydrogenase (short-subunit alcohol dehydrogenase family)